MIVLLAILIGLPAWIGGTILAQRRGASSRTAILIVSLIASALGIVGLVAVVLISPALATPETCINSTGSGFPCFYGGQAKLVALLGIGFRPLLASLLVGMPAWVMALTETTRRKHWGWFVAVLLCSPIAAMLYGFLGTQPHPPAVPPAAPLAAS
jgi:predicted lysophospholipase L1 biosynthesis ABC-type transport system permease subunit